MSAKHKLIVRGTEEWLQRHKEEIAEEFGIHASSAGGDAVTPNILDETGEEKVKSNEDM